MMRLKYKFCSVLVATSLFVGSQEGIIAQNQGNRGAVNPGPQGYGSPQSQQGFQNQPGRQPSQGGGFNGNATTGSANNSYPPSSAAGIPMSAQQQAAQQQAAQQQAAQQQAAQQQAAQQQAAQQQAAQQQAPLARQPLPPDYAKYINEVLLAWQRATSDIQRYQCKFNRWQYNPANTQGNFPVTRGSGEIRYMKPDKGLFKVEKLEVYTNQKDKEGAPAYGQFPNQQGEWWLCDGDFVFEFERDQKMVKRFKLPENMKGLQIAESPLPFVFGIDAAKVQQRYWVEPGPIPNGPDGKPRQDLIVVDTYPKRAEDALNYQKVTIFLDRTKFLPYGLIIFDPSYTPNNPVYEQIEFHSPEVNASFATKIVEKIFMESFIPNPPKDFKIVDLPFIPDPQGGSIALPGNGGPSGPPNAQQPNFLPQQPANGGQRVATPNPQGLAPSR